MGTQLAEWPIQPDARNTKFGPQHSPQRIGYFRMVSSDSSDTPVPVTPTHNRAAEYVNLQLAQLVMNDNLPKATSARAREILVRAMRSDDLLPYLTADEDEVHAHWIAAHASLELSIPAVGDIYVRTTDDAGTETIVDFTPHAPMPILQSVIRRLTRTVELGNPRWRRLFA